MRKQIKYFWNFRSGEIDFNIMVEFSILLFQHPVYIWGLFIVEGSVGWKLGANIKGCQLAGQDTVWEIGTSSGGARSRSFSNIVCRLPLCEGRWECRVAVGRHDISAVQSQPGSSNGLPAKSGGTWISSTAAKQWPRNLIRRGGLRWWDALRV